MRTCFPIPSPADKRVTAPAPPIVRRRALQNGAKCPANRTMRTPDLSHRPLSLRQAGQRPFRAVCERREPAGERRRKSPFPNGLRFSLTSARVCPSDCCGKIPRSGSIRNSKNARSTCNKASCHLLLPGQGSLGSEVHPERICVPPCENHSTMTSGCAKPPRPKLRGLVVLGDAESESS